MLNIKILPFFPSVFKKIIIKDCFFYSNVKSSTHQLWVHPTHGDHDFNTLESAVSTDDSSRFSFSRQIV